MLAVVTGRAEKHDQSVFVLFQIILGKVSSTVNLQNLKRRNIRKTQVGRFSGSSGSGLSLNAVKNSKKNKSHEPFFHRAIFLKNTINGACLKASALFSF